MTLALLLAWLAPASWGAGVPERFTYQGNLREAGVLVTGTRSMRFRLYPAPTGGAPLWDSGATAVALSTGVFRVALAPAGVDWEAAPWLEVEVDGTVLSPREELTAAPYALDALLHSGKRYTSAATAPGAPAPGDLWYDTAANLLKLWNGSAWTAQAAGGLAAVSADAAQFAGNGTAGAPLALRSSSVTLQGNAFNGPGGLVRLTPAGALPALDGSALTGVSAALPPDVARTGTANVFTAPQAVAASSFSVTGPLGADMVVDVSGTGMQVKSKGAVIFRIK